MSVALTDRPAQQAHPLLAFSWVDVSGTPLEEGAPLTADKTLADIFSTQWETQYRAWVDYLQAQHPEDTVDPWSDTLRTHFGMEAEGLATGRLDLYEQRLRAFLQLEPSEDELADWLAHRAITDAAVWARMDAADMRFRASRDFYDANGHLNDKKYTIRPDTASEPRCLDVAGRVFPNQDEAEQALGSVWHKNCIHFVDLA